MAGLFNLFYLIILLVFLVSALFIIYHIVKYSFSKTATVIMLVIFISVAGVLIFSNIILFSSINLERIFSSALINF